MGKGFCESLSAESEVIPLFQRMKREPHPIFIWGTGALAIDVYKYCRNFGVKLSGCFVDVPISDAEFVDMPIWTLEELMQKYPQFSVLIGHANYAIGIERLKRIKNVKHIYYITSCCYEVWNIIAADFLKVNAPVLDAFFDELQDELSKQCLRSYFESRLNDNAAYMFPFYKPGMSYYKNDVIQLTEKEVLLDVGAYQGMAIWPFLDAVKGKYEKIIALEPEDKNYQALKENIAERGLKNIELRQVCAYNKNCQVKFAGCEQLGGISNAEDVYQRYPAITIDALCKELDLPTAISIIKINFPFSVPEILQGGTDLLKTSRPKLIIRAGFDENVLLEIYRTIKMINPMYKFYLRYTVGIPQGLTIFAL